VAGRPIVIDLVGNDSQLRKTLKGASKKLGAFGKSVTKLGVTSAAAFGATAVAIGTKGVMAFSEFESGMAEVMTLLPDAGEEMFGSLSDQVKDFSKEFGVMTSDAIPGLYSALSAGVPPDNVLSFMETAQKAAAAGVTSLESAIDGISSVVNVYGSEVISATEASDLMFTAVKLGKTTFEEIGASISTMAPIAAAVGVPFEALTASIANLSAGGTPTSVAANQMKAAMAELAKGGTKADMAFRDLHGVGLAQFLEGGGTFDEAIISMADGADAAGISVLDMFGSIEAGQGILALTADGGEKFQATLADMQASGGATQTAFETMDATLGASFSKIRANLEVLAIEIGEKVAPYVARLTSLMVDNFDKVKPAIATAREFLIKFGQDAREVFEKVVKWVKDNQTWLTMLAATVGGLMLAVKAYNVVVAIQKTITNAVTAATKIQTTAQAALNAMMAMNPIGLVIAAVVALIAILAVAYFKFEEVREIVDSVWDVFQSMAEAFMDYVWPMIEVVIESIIGVFQRMWTQVKLVVDLVMALFRGDFSAAFDALKAMVANSIGMIVDLFIALPMRLWEAAKPLVGKFALIVSDVAVYLVAKIRDLIRALPGQIVSLISNAASSMLSVGKDIGQWIIDGLLAAIRAAAGAVMAAVQSLIPDIGSMVSGAVGGIGGALKGAFGFGATGGIVTQPTLAMIGEAGPEAVIPLSRTPGSSPLPGGGTTFNIVVNAGMGTDGHQVGNQIVSALKQWERSNGSLPLTVSAA
jgi:TP901 family phage tail tape measure protein